MLVYRPRSEICEPGDPPAVHGDNAQDPALDPYLVPDPGYRMLGLARGLHPSLPRWIAAGTVGVIVLLGAANLVRGWRTHRRRGAPPPD